MAAPSVRTLEALRQIQDVPDAPRQVFTLLVSVFVKLSLDQQDAVAEDLDGFFHDNRLASRRSLAAMIAPAMAWATAIREARRRRSDADADAG